MMGTERIEDRRAALLRERERQVRERDRHAEAIARIDAELTDPEEMRRKQRIVDEVRERGRLAASLPGPRFAGERAKMLADYMRGRDAEKADQCGM
jgi:hypothetical protein